MQILFVLIFIILVLILITPYGSSLQGGKISDWNKYSYIKKIYTPGSQTGSRKICTGCAISPNLILTSAHCVKDVPNEDIKIQSATTGNEIILEDIADKRVNSQFNPNGKADSVIYDIALLKVEKPMKEYVKPIFLEIPRSDIDETLVAGFGQDGSISGNIGVFKTGRMSLIKESSYYLGSTIKGQDLCTNFQQNKTILESESSRCNRCNKIPVCSCNNGICEKDGTEEEVAAILQGDSGGAVFYLQNNKVIGTLAINAATRKDGDTRYSYFTSIPKNVDFIEYASDELNSQVNSQEIKTDTFDQDDFKYKYTAGVVLIAFILFTAAFAYKANVSQNIKQEEEEEISI